MDYSTLPKEEEMILCICPSCKISRKKLDKKLTIVKRGHERNGLARFLCLNCSTWFNEQSGETMRWLSRY